MDLSVPFVPTNSDNSLYIEMNPLILSSTRFKPFDAFLDRYLINDLISESSYAKVISIYDRIAREDLCAKVICKQFCNPNSILLLDSSTLTSIRHDNIIEYKDIYESDDEIIIIMERAFGGELLDQIIAKCTFSEIAASRIIKQILLAVAYLHSNHIIHRDIKPENILLPIAGNDTYIKLSDFGLSKIMEGEQADLVIDSPRPRTFSMVGSDYYTAPEVYKRKGYDYKVDIFSIGIVCYILLCGYNPYCGPNGVCFRSDGLAMEPPYWDGISEAAKDFVRCLLRTDPDRRPSAEECLCHPWIRNPADHAIQVNQPFIDNITRSRRLSTSI